MATVTVTSKNGAAPENATLCIFQSQIAPGTMRPTTSGNTATACKFSLLEWDDNLSNFKATPYVVSETYAQVKAELDADNAGITVAQLYGVASGTNTYAVTLSTGMSALTVGLPFYVKFGITNTGAATLAVNGLAATAIRKGTGGATALSASDLVVTKIYTLIYDGTNFQINL